MTSLSDKLSLFPHIAFAQRPTPLEFLPNLTKRLAGPEIWMKRDDCTGLAGGGNKARKLEFLLADARATGADTLITAGGMQSNHARQTAAAGAKEGFRVILTLADLVPGRGRAYRQNGNLLLDHLFGAQVHRLPGDADMVQAMTDMAEHVRRSGGRPYVIPIGGSSGHGVLGHVEAGLELAMQVRARALDVSRIIVASGSGGTQAGLLVASIETGIPVNGFCVGINASEQRDKIRKVLSTTAALLDIDSDTLVDRIELDDRFVGAGYGHPTAEMIEAVKTLAQVEGILLDPVYTGKAMAGLIESVRSGRLDRTERVVFMHTGGSIGLFAYAEELNTAMGISADEAYSPIVKTYCTAAQTPPSRSATLFGQATPFP